MEQQKANSPASPQLDGSMDELSKHLEETSSFESKARTISVLLYFLILAVFLWFGWMFYRTIQKNFTQEKFLQSVETRGKEMIPKLEVLLGKFVEKVKPVYVAEAKKQINDTVPKLKGLAENELNGMVDNAKKEVNGILQEAMKTKYALVKSLYPNLSEADFNIATIANEKAWNDEFVDITKTLIEPFRQDWDKMRTTLDKFNNPDLPNDQVELLKQMEHNLLMMLDKELMEVK